MGKETTQAKEVFSKVKYKSIFFPGVVLVIA